MLTRRLDQNTAVDYDNWEQTGDVGGMQRLKKYEMFYIFIAATYQLNPWFHFFLSSAELQCISMEKSQPAHKLWNEASLLTNC